MELDYNWEPGQNDSRARRWVRRVAFVLGLVIMVWVVALISGGDANADKGDEEGQLPQASSTYRPENPLKPMEWNDDRLYMTAGIVDLGWRHAINAKRDDLCSLMKTGYHEKAARSILEGEAADAYKRSFELDKIGEGIDWYFAAELLEVKCLRRL
ncbi:membrane protein [Streptomyces phage Lizz]|nr:membrane protein [Streptomyces phage PHTowN]QNO12861.1 membrane protein [Streptomyces phage ShakeNBake]QYW07591.1 membrane protein [Streptomyces phage Lizz]